MIRRPPKSTPFPTRRSSDLHKTKAYNKHKEQYTKQYVLLRLVRQESLKSELRCESYDLRDRKSTRLNSSHEWISYAVFCLKKKKKKKKEEIKKKEKQERKYE